MASFTDQLNKQVNLSETPKRIISLVPSQTELLFDLGLDNEVVGITKFCVHPDEWFRTKTKVGGTKIYDFEKIKSLNPDLIIGNKEENEQQQIEKLMKEYPVWMSDIKTLDENYKMIESIGEIVNRKEKTNEIVNTIKKNYSQLLPIAIGTTNHKLQTAYFIWQKPFIVAGKETFINHLMEKCGMENTFINLDSRYPEVSEEQIANTKADLILLSSEPFPFKEKHIETFRKISPASKILLVDGELFSWYGSRLIKSPAYFSQLLGNL